ncbi:response regulator, partial [bacterium AH-315-M10]|nr:response regulator [bacterium AH-315-M10]
MAIDRKKILIADDDENLRGLLRVLFEDSGYEIHEASSGKQALKEFERIQPDLILLDVHFGGSGLMSGYDVLHEVRRDPICMDVPVILLTGYCTEEQVVRGFEAGADDYVSKPFSPRELAARVESRIRRHSDTKARAREQTDLRPGKTVRGAQGHVYEVGPPLSRGGMGVVYRGTCLDDGKQICLKTLDGGRLRRNKDLKRFELEARVALRFDHPNLARGIDLRISPEICFLVMEYIEGETLASRVNRSGPLDTAEGISVALQICGALAHIDSHDMVHRDVKPENILLSPGGRATLVDFGLTKSTSDDSAHLTTDGIILGTPYYISPEQVKGMLQLDVRSDIYCLGASMYFALSGKKPF